MITRQTFARIAGATLASAVLAASLAMFGCGGSSEEPAEEEAAAPQSDVVLQVFAANSLQKALPEVQDLYTAKTGVTFADSQFEASNTLVEKLESGGTADVLITASKKTMDKAEGNESTDPETRVDMFVNDLIICTAADSDLQITSVEDLATDAVTSFAIGDPNVVPAGKYALQTLESAGLATYDEDDEGNITNIVYDPSIADKVNAGADKVGTVATYVSDGTVQCGFVYTSDIYRYDGIQQAFVVPGDAHKTIVYPAAVCTTSANPDVAADFINFCMTDPDALAIFSQYGFELA